MPSRARRDQRPPGTADGLLIGSSATRFPCRRPIKCLGFVHRIAVGDGGDRAPRQHVGVEGRLQRNGRAGGIAEALVATGVDQVASETQGGPTSCKDEATWSAYGAMACAGKGLVLNHISFATSYGAGLYREATYDCCTSTTPNA